MLKTFNITDKYKDIIIFLETKKNQSSYICELILKDMQNETLYETLDTHLGQLEEKLLVNHQKESKNGMREIREEVKLEIRSEVRSEFKDMKESFLEDVKKMIKTALSDENAVVRGESVIYNQSDKMLERPSINMRGVLKEDGTMKFEPTEKKVPPLKQVATPL